MESYDVIFFKYKQNIDLDELTIKTQIGLYPVELLIKMLIKYSLKRCCYDTVAENCSIYYNPPEIFHQHRKLYNV